MKFGKEPDHHLPFVHKNKPQRADQTSLATMLVLQLNIANTRWYNVFIQQHYSGTYMRLRNLFEVLLIL